MTTEERIARAMWQGWQDGYRAILFEVAPGEPHISRRKQAWEKLSMYERDLWLVAARAAVAELRAIIAEECA